MAMAICKIRDPLSLNGAAPLHVAAWSGNLDVFQYVFETALDKNPRDNEGLTPFHWAAFKGHLEICHIQRYKGEIRNFAPPHTY